jgi:hypothetical protein
MVPKHGNLVKVHLHRASLLMINSFNDDEIIRLSVNTDNSQFHWFLLKVILVRTYRVIHVIQVGILLVWKVLISVIAVFVQL